MITTPNPNAMTTVFPPLLCNIVLFVESAIRIYVITIIVIEATENGIYNVRFFFKLDTANELINLNMTFTSISHYC